MAEKQRTDSRAAKEYLRRLTGIGISFFMAAAGLQAAATNRYVATNGGSVYPYTNWADAGTSINAVVAVAGANNAGDMVIISNGTYYTSQITITNNLIVTNFTGDRTKVIIDGNYPTIENRCFYIKHVNAIVSGFTITNGYANTNSSEGRGGGVYLYYGTVKDCLITGNRSNITNSSSYGGGGIYAGYGTVDACSVIGNIVTGIPGLQYSGGGGISLYRESTITNCYVAYNTATNAYGGGIQCNGGEILNCTIGHNTAWGSGYYCNGGGISDLGSAYTMDIINCIVISNICNGHGGGMYLRNSSPTVIKNCLIQANRGSGYASGQGAGIVLSGNISCDINSCTIVSNLFAAGDGYGGGIYFASDFARMSVIWNCIIYYNYANSGANLYDGSGGKNKTSIVYSCTSPGSGFNITGVVTSQPSFADAADNNYRLDRSSPCINAGTNRSWMTNGVDLDGHTRIDPFSGMVDMGCYEYLFSGMRFGFR